MQPAIGLIKGQPRLNEAGVSDAVPESGLLARLGTRLRKAVRLRRLRRLVGFYPIMAIVLIGLVWFVAFQAIRSHRQEQVNQNITRAGELAATFEVNTQKALGYADAYVRAARQIYLQTGSAAAVEAALQAVPPDPSFLSHITILDAAGTPVLLSGHDFVSTDQAANSPYFQFQKSTPGDAVYVSLPDTGSSTGLTSLRLVRRIQNPDGSFAGVLFGVVPARHFTSQFKALIQGDNSVALLIGTDGKIRTRSRNGAPSPGFGLGEFPIGEDLKGQPAGMFSQVSAVDDVERLYAYRRIAGYPLVGLIGIANDDIVGTTHTFSRATLAIAALMSVVIIVLTSSIQRGAYLMRSLKHEVAVRRRAEGRAVHANDIKSTFLANMSHEVRTPINAIMGLFELIEAAEVPARQQRQARAGQVAAGELLKQLTNVLDVSRLEAKSLDLNIRTEQLAPLFSDLLHLLEAAIATAGKPIEASIEIIGDVPETALMDRRRVDQIVINLIDNAVKFTSEGKIDLQVSSGECGGVPVLCIAVSDTGSGIPAEGLGRVFDRFAQIDGAMTRKTGGTGLGLSICKELAALMHGDLTVQSTEGAGTTFTLILPVESAE